MKSRKLSILLLCIAIGISGCSNSPTRPDRQFDNSTHAASENIEDVASSKVAIMLRKEDKPCKLFLEKTWLSEEVEKQIEFEIKPDDYPELSGQYQLTVGFESLFDGIEKRYLILRHKLTTKKWEIIGSSIVFYKKGSHPYLTYRYHLPKGEKIAGLEVQIFNAAIARAITTEPILDGNAADE